MYQHLLLPSHLGWVSIESTLPFACPLGTECKSTDIIASTCINDAVLHNNNVGAYLLPFGTVNSTVSVNKILFNRHILSLK